MPAFLIDVNLPYYFNLWNNPQYVHQADINPKAKDKEIWQYAIEQNLIIVTKDSDFSNRIILSIPPPKVIHIRLGNVAMKDFYQIINNCWGSVSEMIQTHKLVTVYEHRLEGIN